jgi:hypothetical protein
MAAEVWSRFSLYNHLPLVHFCPAVGDKLDEPEDLVSLENGCVCCSLRKDIVKWVLACSAPLLNPPIPLPAPHDQGTGCMQGICGAGEAQPKQEPGN